MASKPWGGAGAWAVEAERAEAEEKERAALLAASGGQEAFPSLVDAAKSKKKKQQQQTISLSEFNTGKYVGPGGGKSRSLSDSTAFSNEEMMSLPIRPRERSDEEQTYGRLGGGFRDYGYRGKMDRPDRGRDRGFDRAFERDRESGSFRREHDRDEPSRADESSNWTGARKPLGYGDDRRGETKISDRELPSRADEVDNWTATKKVLPVFEYDRRSGRSQERKQGFDESRLSSRADEVENWSSGKKALPPAPAQQRRGFGFDSSYRDSRVDADRWKGPFPEDPQKRRLALEPRGRPFSTSPPPGDRGSIGAHTAQPSSPTGVSDTLHSSLSKARINPFGGARPREEVLAEKGHDWKRIETDYLSSKDSSRPSSSHSSRPATPDGSIEVSVKPRPKINPFGNARPREVLLEEKGLDWRKIDFELEHRAVDRPETEGEKMLKEEIKVLTSMIKQQPEVIKGKINGVVTLLEEVEGGKRPNIEEQLLFKERQLEQLVRALDDKVRFSQRAGERLGPRSEHGDVERPGSRSGQGENREFDSLERPSSHSGRSEGGRSLDSVERPGSHSGWAETARNFDSQQRPGSRSGHDGTGYSREPSREGRGPDIWTRPGEEYSYDRDVRGVREV